MPYKVNEPVEPQQRAVIDDDQLKRMMADSQPSFFERNRYRLVTLALIAINVAVFALEAVLSGMRIDISTRTLVDMGAMYAPLVQSPADLYRFVTPMFLHMDLMHLGFNMVALYSVGEVLERTLGKGSYLDVYKRQRRAWARRSSRPGTSGRRSATACSSTTCRSRCPRAASWA